MAKISFTVYGNPQALKRHRSFQTKSILVGRKIRQGIVRQYDPSKGDKADFLAKALEHRPRKPLEGALRMWVSFYFARPQSHFGKKGLKASAPKFHTQKPDTSNLSKFVEDALAGVFYADDKQICHGPYPEKEWCDEHEAPRVVITIEELE